MLEAVVGERPYAVCNVDGEVHAIDGLCPHHQGPLAQGALHGNMVVCPWHAWEFDCRTGENDRSPEANVRSIPVKVEGGDILIDVG
jgi:nitrite reductase/ring-hydroxylating ferredoxin subunit